MRELRPVEASDFAEHGDEMQPEVRDSADQTDYSFA
jgi:hypothetical protein